MSDHILDHINGTSECSLIYIDGNPVFHKTLKQEIKNRVLTLEKKVQMMIFSGTPSAQHIDRTQTKKDILEKEILTWKIWKEAGYEVPELVGHTDNEIMYEFIPSESYKTFIEKNEKITDFDKLVELYSKIRSDAKERNDCNWLHSDPHLGNFLYQNKTSRFIPIDSGTNIKLNLGFDTIDFNLLLFTLSSIANLNIGENLKKEATYIFGQSLTEFDKERFSRLDLQVPLVLETYYLIREEIAYRYKGREKMQHLKPLKTFYDAFNRYMKDILIE